MELFRMAERFSDPLFEKVGNLSIKGWIAWIEFFAMEEESSIYARAKEQGTNELVKCFESKGGYVF